MAPLTTSCDIYRSAVLFQINEFKTCIRDVQSALESGYPADLAYKLYERKGKCCMKLKMYHEAAESLEKALELARRNIQDESKLVQFIKEVEKFKSAIPKSGAAANGKILNLDGDDDETPMLTGVNPQMPSFSKSVKIVHSKAKGRHGIATRKIECGEIVMVEKCNFNFPMNTFRGKICSHCLKSTLDLMPTPLNSVVRSSETRMFYQVNRNCK